MAIELNYACAECVQLTTNWSLGYNFFINTIIKSKMATISWKKTWKNYFCFFFILFQTDLNKYKMKSIVLKIK